MPEAKVEAIVMAAGRGTRMGSEDLPKVLFPVNGQPMLHYVLKTLVDAGVESPIIVVGYLADKVREVFGSGYRYATQSKQDGTATAVKAAQSELEGKECVTVIASGDQPFIKSRSIKKLIEIVAAKGAVISLLVGEFEESEFDAFGRVIVDEAGFVQEIVEAKNANPEQLKTRLFNMATYAVDNEWLWQALQKIKKNELTGEYYLTDIVAMAVQEGRKVAIVKTTDVLEAIGINSPAQLKLAEEKLG